MFIWVKMDLGEKKVNKFICPLNPLRISKCICHSVRVLHTFSSKGGAMPPRVSAKGGHRLPSFANGGGGDFFYKQYNSLSIKLKESYSNHLNGF